MQQDRFGVRPRLVAVVCALAVIVVARPGAGQSVLDRSPNLSGGWVADAGVLQFNFLHRFHQSGAPQRKITSSPSFLLGVGLPGQTMVGAKYATNSDVVPSLPNEWEFFGRYAPLTQAAGGPLDVAMEAGYNLGAESIDGAVSLARRLGPLRVIGAARAFSNAYDAGDVRYALAAGASVRLLEWLALAGDVVSLLDRNGDADQTIEERVAWGAGLQLQVPYTPHTLSLHATNVNTATLEGSSRGTDRVRYGFEFTIPVTLRRYLPAPEEAPPVASGDTAVAAFEGEANTFRISIMDLAYGTTTIEVPAGATVVWVNEDPVIHTVTADSGDWDSGEIAPGESWSRTFAEPGSYAYHCIPHPFMQATVVVTEP